jgi:PadR family transcriptional regulator, regulatory protein PadR
MAVKVKPEVLPGTLDLMVLRVLRDGAGHGYAVARAIERRSGGVLVVEEGSLYPALHRLEKRGSLASEWRETESGRRGKVYRLTSAGHTALSEQVKLWGRLSGAVTRVVG